MTTCVPATTEVFQLAEGPVWDAARWRLLWVDILAGVVLEGVLDGDRIEIAPPRRPHGQHARNSHNQLVRIVCAVRDHRLTTD